MYDCMFDYEFEEALRDLDRVCDWDEREVKNRPQDDADDWEQNCLSEEAHRRMLEKAAEEYRKERERIKRWLDMTNTK